MNVLLSKSTNKHNDISMNQHNSKLNQRDCCMVSKLGNRKSNMNTCLKNWIVLLMLHLPMTTSLICSSPTIGRFIAYNAHLHVPI